MVEAAGKTDLAALSDTGAAFLKNEMILIVEKNKQDQNSCVEILRFGLNAGMRGQCVLQFI
jgi:hypothetical protein